nr:variable surface lipoprotein [Mycoplasmopsis bovis]
MKKSKFLLLGSVASLASIPFVAAKCGETKEEKKPRSDKPKLSETLKSILVMIGKGTSCWIKINQQQRKNWSRYTKKLCYKSTTLKDKELKLNLISKKTNCS